MSAGRVQSVAVRLIVEREKEIINFKSTSDFKVVIILENSKNELIKAELPKRFKTESEAYDFMQKCLSAEFTVENLEKKAAKKSPTAPFTTSTLQQEASRKLGFSVNQTMTVAQKLYESGKITYMRTDSVNLSDDALDAANSEIVKLYGADYANRKSYSNKSKGAQEAHEAIRPSYMQERTIEGDSSLQKLYDLIWKRTISSQMSDAKIDRTIVKIGLSNSQEKLTAKGEVITFDGFMKVYLEGKDEENSNEKGILPALNQDETLNLREGSANEQFTRHPARYTEASLVKKMEELGIGRPSTYAATITTVQKRGYVEKDTREGQERIAKSIILKNGNLSKEDVKSNYGAEKNKLFPTDVGVVVTEFLLQNFENIMQYSFTASVEDEFDQIAAGKKAWNDMIAAFYSKFHNQVEKVSETEGKSLGQRTLGVDPKSGKNLYARIGPFGPMVQLGEKSDNENDPKPKFASLLKGQTIQTIKFEEAMKLFDLPRTVGLFEGEEIVAAIGRFGPYLRYKGKFTSIKKSDNEDPLTISLDRSIELIKAKIQADKDRIVANFDGNPLVQVLNGRYGVFIQITPDKGKKINVKIPKDIDPNKLSREECLDLMENQKKK